MFALYECAVRYLLLQLERVLEHRRASACVYTPMDASTNTEAGLLIEKAQEEENSAAPERTHGKSIEMSWICS